MTRLLRYYLLLCPLLLLSACDTNDCTLYNVVALNTAFYNQGTAVALTDTLTVTGCGAQSVLLNRKTSTSTMQLPLSYWNATDTLVLHLATENGTYRDTIWVDKTNRTHFEAPDCPATQFHEIQNVRSTHTFIDHITVTRPTVDYETVENIQIHILGAE